jgi:DNA-binding NarL/FixJ family response regulator
MQINRAADPKAAQSLTAPSGDPSRQKPSDAPRVLLVDDNEVTLTRAKSVLSCTCVVVGIAVNGQAALEVAAATNPDVVVLDISMPGMNGFELAKRLRASGSTAHLVFLTVHEEEELILAARNVGAVGYVVKSRLAADLEAAVREASAGRPFQSPAR